MSEGRSVLAICGHAMGAKDKDRKRGLRKEGGREGGREGGTDGSYLLHGAQDFQHCPICLPEEAEPRHLLGR